MCDRTSSKIAPLDPRLLTDEQLVTRVAAGDREAAAEFLRRNRRLIAARYRWKLRQQPSRLADTDDFLSTLARRFDRFVAERTVLASGVGRLLSLVDRIAQRASSELVRRARRVHERESAGARSEAVAPPDRVEQFELRTLVDGGVLDESAGELVRLRLSGLSHEQVARHLGISAPAARQRWGRALRQLRHAIDDSADDEGEHDAPARS